ncbi:MAG: hypothetical protein JWR79_1017 [Tardiphaga sp.]|nr:hypothetical protein [Tardiphaga sp.]
MFALVYSNRHVSNFARLRLKSCDCFTLQIQNQRNPKGERPVGFQVVIDDIKRQIVLAKSIFDLTLRLVIDWHVRLC